MQYKLTPGFLNIVAFNRDPDAQITDEELRTALNGCHLDQVVFVGVTERQKYALEAAGIHPDCSRP